MKLLAQLAPETEVKIGFDDFLSVAEVFMMNFHLLSVDQQKRFLEFMHELKRVALYNSSVEACEQCAHHKCDTCPFYGLLNRG